MGTCMADTDCHAAQVCDAVVHRCARACLGDAATCPPDRPICSRSRSVCVQCTSDADCMRGRANHCLLPENSCVQCVTDADCKTAERCNPERHACVGTPGDGGTEDSGGPPPPPPPPGEDGGPRRPGM
jgi:hypothetical protein